MKIRPYRLKHKPTGLYYVKKSYGKLSERGTVYTTSQHSLQRMYKVYITVPSNLIPKYEEKLKTIEGADVLYNKPIVGPSHITSWNMMCPVTDFEKEYLDECPDLRHLDINQITTNVNTITSTIQDLRELDSALEFCDGVENLIKTNTPEILKGKEQEALMMLDKVAGWIKELRDIKKNNFPQQVDSLRSSFPSSISKKV